ncbi:hypothetical protein DOY81_012450 [Sarcophaga bullata]|nr:hypothetical protein DOY81_012450 [Sarcophaga bullata]
MWFEVLPSAVIITVALSIPTYAMYGIHKLTLGNMKGERNIFHATETISIPIPHYSIYGINIIASVI